MTRRRSTTVLAAGLLLLALLSPLSAATFAPAVLLFVALGRGVRPGEELMVRWLARSAPRVRRRAARGGGAPRLPVVARPAGAALAMALGMRPPPARA